jgi:hypothetical protein
VTSGVMVGILLGEGFQCETQVVFWRLLHGPNCKNTKYHTCIYNRLREDGLSGSKHVEEFKKLKY